MTDQSSTAATDSLFQLIIEKKWGILIEFYKTHSWALHAKLTKSEETALHVAITCYESGPKGTEGIYIERMIDCIPNEQLFNTLSRKNNIGNTPLHLAATVGWIEVCDNIASKWPDLIKIRNSKGETPVFMAARHGKSKAFLCFSHYYCPEKKEERQKEFELICRRSDGNTVLHSAISGAHFRLAYQIICDYPNLVNSVNILGESPLHVLAKKPHVFKSNGHLGFYDSITYACLFVDELKSRSYDEVKQQDDSDYSNYPKNYETCYNIFRLIWTTILKISRIFVSPGNRFDEENPQYQESDIIIKDDNGSFPPNCATCISFFKFAAKVMVTLIAVGTARLWRVNKIKKMKQRYSDAVDTMNKMIESRNSAYKYKNDGMKPTGELDPQIFSSLIIYEASRQNTDQSGGNRGALVKNETPVLMAAKMGIPKMVKKIYSECPVAIQDLNSNGKNVLMLAAENRQIRVLEYLLSLKLPQYMFNQVDNEGNNIMHLAAKLTPSQPWRTPDVVLQMQAELKWYKFVKYSVPTLSFARHNKNGETPKQIFTSTHETLVKDASISLTKTSESCSLIAALVATVAFATSSTVPGGLDDATGHPKLRDHIAFHVFSITSVLALCLSVTALAFFVSVITSSCEQRDLKDKLPLKLFMGLTTLFASLTAMVVSFFAGHAFILKENLWIVAFPLYFVACAPLTIFVITKLPLYYNLLRASMKGIIQRPYGQRPLNDGEIIKEPIHRPYRPDLTMNSSNGPIDQDHNPSMMKKST